MCLLRSNSEKAHRSLTGPDAPDMVVYGYSHVAVLEMTSSGRDFSNVGSPVNTVTWEWYDPGTSTLENMAVNYGPGDPIYAHKADEQVPVEHLHRVHARLRRWLTGDAD